MVVWQAGKKLEMATMRIVFPLRLYPNPGCRPERKE